MSLSFRKILVVGIITLGIGVLGLGFWIILSNLSGYEPNKITPGDTTKVSDSQTDNIGQQIEKNIQDLQKPSKIRAFSDKPALGISFNKEGNRVIYYDKETGYVFQISFDGKIWERISDTSIDGLKSVSWAPSRDKAIIERSAGQSQGKEVIEKYVYDYNTGKKHDLSNKIGRIVFSPNGKKILYHYWDPGKLSNVSIANYDGSNWEMLFESEMTGLRLSWPKQDTVSFISSEVSFAGADLYFMKLERPYSLTEMIKNKFGLLVNWSPTGNKLFYSSQTAKDSEMRSLYLRDFEKGTETGLAFKTLPQNCVWTKDETALYCAEETKNFVQIIPKDYQKQLSLAGDSFWKIDLTVREFQEIYIPKQGEQIYDATEMIVSDSQDYLFFINKLDGKLYGIDL